MNSKKKTIKVFDKKIELVEQPLSWSVDNDALGMYTPSEKTIELYKRMGSKKRANTLIHELMHSIIHLAKIRFLSERQEESLVHKLSDYLCEIFKRNPDILDEFIEGIRVRSEAVRYRTIKKPAAKKTKVSKKNSR